MFDIRHLMLGCRVMALAAVAWIPTLAIGQETPVAMQPADTASSATTTDTIPVFERGIQ